MTPRTIGLPRRRRTLLSAAALVIGGGAVIGLGGGDAPPVRPYGLVQGEVPDGGVGAAGTVATGRLREVAFGTSGTVEKVYVKAGETVRDGDVLAVLDDVPAREQVTAAQAALAAAKEARTTAGSPTPSSSCSGASTAALAAVATRTPSPTPSSPRPSPTPTPTPTGSPTPRPTKPTKPGTPTKPGKPTKPTKPRNGGKGGKGGSGCSGGSAAPRGQSGGGSGGGTQQALTIPQADANVVKAEVKLAQAQRALGGTTLHATIDGTVLSIGSVGAKVSGPGAQGFVTIGDLEELQVQAAFSQGDVAGLSLGQPATITVAGTAARPGTVTRIDPVPVATGALVQYTVMIAFDAPPDDLRLGQSATVTIS